MRISLGTALVGLALLLPATGHCGITYLQDYDGNGATTGNSGLIFRQPSFSGSTGGNLDTTTYNSTKIVTDQAVSGTHSLRAQFQFKDTDPNRWLRLTTYGADPVIDGTGALTFWIRVESADPTAAADPLAVCLGIKEIDYASDPVIGSKGTGASKGLEFIGATGTTSGAPDATRIVTPGSWQQLMFIMPQEPAVSFSGGNGILEPKFGKVNLEQIAFRSLGSNKGVNVYIDDIVTRSIDTIPEPGTMALLATGLLPLLGLRRRTR